MRKLSFLELQQTLKTSLNQNARKKDTKTMVIKLEVEPTFTKSNNSGLLSVFNKLFAQILVLLSLLVEGIEQTEFWPPPCFFFFTAFLLESKTVKDGNSTK